MSKEDATKKSLKPTKPQASVLTPKPPEPENVLFRGSQEPVVNRKVEIIKPMKKR